MKKVGNMVGVMVLMMSASCISLALISILANIQEWQANKALLGIIVTYMIAGFVGGFSQRIRNKETKGIGKRITEGIGIASAFMLLLTVLSIFAIGTPFVLSSRFLMVWGLLMGSACLGRIL